MPFPRLSDVNVPQATLETIGREQRISADSHMTEPPDLWEKRLPPALRTAPRVFRIATPPVATSALAVGTRMSGSRTWHMMASVQKCSTPAGAMPPIQWGTRSLRKHVAGPTTTG